MVGTPIEDFNLPTIGAPSYYYYAAADVNSHTGTFSPLSSDLNLEVFNLTLSFGATPKADVDMNFSFNAGSGGSKFFKANNVDVDWQSDMNNQGFTLTHLNEESDYFCGNCRLSLSGLLSTEGFDELGLIYALSIQGMEYSGALVMEPLRWQIQVLPFNPESPISYLEYASSIEKLNQHLEIMESSIVFSGDDLTTLTLAEGIVGTLEPNDGSLSWGGIQNENDNFSEFFIIGQPVMPPTAGVLEFNQLVAASPTSTTGNNYELTSAMLSIDVASLDFAVHLYLTDPDNSGNGFGFNYDSLIGADRALIHALQTPSLASYQYSVSGFAANTRISASFQAERRAVYHSFR